MEQEAVESLAFESEQLGFTDDRETKDLFIQNPATLAPIRFRAKAKRKYKTIQHIYGVRRSDSRNLSF